MLNVVVLIGRLASDPTLRYTPGGKAVADFRVAVERGTKDPSGKNEVDWINCVVWEKQAEALVNYTGKGSLVAVKGRLQIRHYEKDGIRHEKAEVQADNVRFLDRKGTSQQNDADSDDIPY